MEIYFGNLSVNGFNSFLDEKDRFWLLKAGFPDARQAAIAATNFIKNVRRLEGGPVAVTGKKGSIGSQPIIVMSDINAAGSMMEVLTAADAQEGVAVDVSAPLFVPNLG